MSEKKQHSGRGWAWGIAATYGFFAAMTLLMVFFAFGAPVELVSPDYYQRGIDHQQRIEATARALELPAGVDWSITRENGALRFHLPTAHFDGDPHGRIHFYRPDDSRLDRNYGITLDDDDVQHIDVTDLQAGRWLVQIEWRVAGVKYYVERELTIES